MNKEDVRESFSEWAALTIEMMDDGGLPSDDPRLVKIREMLEGEHRHTVRMVFAAGWMGAEKMAEDEEG